MADYRDCLSETPRVGVTPPTPGPLCTCSVPAAFTGPWLRGPQAQAGCPVQAVWSQGAGHGSWGPTRPEPSFQRSGL